MRKFTSILLLLFCVTSFAGDLYLVCEDEVGDFIIEKSIDPQVESTSLEFHDMSSDRYSFEIEYNHLQGILTYTVYEMNSWLELESSQVKVEYLTPFNLPLGHTCTVRD